MGRIRAAWDVLTRRDLASDEIGWHDRSGRRLGGPTPRVTSDQALRHSAVWACLRLRANLVSSLPVDAYRNVGGISVEVAKPRLLVTPEPGVPVAAWLWSSQYDLDRYGNTMGVITARDRKGRIAEVELAAAGDVTVRTKGRRIVKYKIDGTWLDPDEVWHETQYRPAGSPLGLSPIAYAAWSIAGYLSAQEFARAWYDSGAHPSGVLKNTAKMVDQKTAMGMKERFKNAVQDRDVFVTGSDWEFTPAAADANSAAFLDEMQYGVTDVCRFLDVPADMVDAASQGSHITYANITQRNVQLLVTSIGPAVKRREDALSAALAGPQFVKLNTDALLRMDPETRARVINGKVTAKLLTPTEGRALDDYAPYTDEDIAEIERLYGAPRQLEAPAAQRNGWVPPDAYAEVVSVTSDPWGKALAIESGPRP